MKQLAASLFVLCAISGAVNAAPIIESQSELKATFKQFNVPVTGEFKAFSGEVNYDPTQPQATTGSLVVKTNSYDLGDDAYNAEVAGEDWFDSSAHPEATFKLLSVTPVGKAFDAKGELTLRGKTKPVNFSADLKQLNDTYQFTGKASIKRLDFGVGQGDWEDTSLVEDAVIIEFKLVTPAK